ncbi:cysteine methyltransferase [Melaminivora suipulveris]|uniref:Methylated-DNA--protein-cysteine methyltransferase n=1 Tax=Melaminivora suipulveris TaxID=2109913 RepID=A0A2R3Q8B6_9BURK|nr:methylated-DNA--[protein]-cysteine S-methyltransferase [Melaminivora suipulveris]AVO48011.1 cysteine methyltransferase [Melaminivora suipulveris]
MPTFPSCSQITVATPLGAVHLAASARGLAGLWFAGQRHLPAQLASPVAWPVDDDHRLLRLAATQLGEYLAGERTAFDVPLDPSAGTPFQQSVWQALQGIPRGSTVSYGALAQRLGRARAVRAVAAAIARNPLSVVVPCHRVLGSGGALTGYAGGLERKTALLRLEGVPIPPFDPCATT